MMISTGLFILLYCFVDISFSLQWIAEGEVGSYGSYRNVRFSRYDIPVGTKEVTWDFRPRKTPTSCEEIPIYVYIQFGSIPPINAKNETYPDDFYLERRNQFRLTLHPDNTSQTFTIPNPRPGSWYSGMYRPYQEGKINPKGLFTRCKYFVAMSYDTLADVFYLPVSSSGKTSHLLLSNITKHIQLQLEERVYEYTVSLHDCQPDCDNIQITYLETQLNSSLPDTFNCSTGNPCQFTVTSPTIDMLQKFDLRILDNNTGNINVSLTIDIKECVHHEDDIRNTNACVLYNNLDRLQFKTDFNVAFAYIKNDTIHPIIVNVTNDVTNNLPFNLMPQLDMGGTLVVELTLIKTALNTTLQHTRACGLLLHGHLVSGPVDNSDVMNQDGSLCSNSSGESVGNLYVPYPESGSWFISLSVDCYTVNESSIIKEPCHKNQTKVRLVVSTSSCYHGKCSGRGECKEFVVSPSLIVYSTCTCNAGWRGYGCTDDTDAYSAGLQLQEVLLLTLSNLFFIPGILLALKRRYYVEALIYTYNMFFSTFYHACDGDREDKYTLCIMKYNVLSFCDFLGSVCSLWVTVVAMAKVHTPMSAVLQISAPLFLVIGVLYDRINLLVIGVPLFIALILVAITWVLRCKIRKRCYPTKKRYILFLLPGVLIATTGGLIYALAETDSNYRYVHSVWHMTISLSIIFLLPPRKVHPGASGKCSINGRNGVSLLACDQSDNDSDLNLIPAVSNVNNTNLVL